MLPEEREFPKFAWRTSRNLYRAILSDTDLFLLTVSGVLLGSARKRQRGLGTALALYLIFRRLDNYVDVHVQLARLAQTTKQTMEFHGTAIKA